MKAPPQKSRPAATVRQATKAVRSAVAGQSTTAGTKKPMHAVDTRGAGKRIAVEKSSDPAFADYLRQAEKYQLLDAVQERILGMTLQAGLRTQGLISPQARHARDRLITSNLMLVVSIAACYTQQGVPLADIVQAGNIGLIKAVDKYVPGRARFATYAGWWIARECGVYVMATADVIRVPRDVATNMRRISRATRRMEVDAVDPDADNLAEATMLTPKQVRRALNARALQDTLSLDTGWLARNDGDDYNGDETGHQLGDMLTDDSQAPDLIADKQDEAEELHRKLATILSSRERQVLQLHFGLGDSEELTQKQIARRMGITDDAVSAIMQGALAKLRESYDLDQHPERLHQLRIVWSRPAAG